MVVRAPGFVPKSRLWRPDVLRRSIFKPNVDRTPGLRPKSTHPVHEGREAAQASRTCCHERSGSGLADRVGSEVTIVPLILEMKCCHLIRHLSFFYFVTKLNLLCKINASFSKVAIDILAMVIVKKRNGRKMELNRYNKLIDEKTRQCLTRIGVLAIFIGVGTEILPSLPTPNKRLESQDDFWGRCPSASRLIVVSPKSDWTTAVARRAEICASQTADNRPQFLKRPRKKPNRSKEMEIR